MKKGVIYEKFVDGGYLQEVNRRFFHPLGFALEATENSAGRLELSIEHSDLY